MSKSTPLEIAFLDVGHGDTIVISIIEDNIKRGIIIDCNDVIKTKKYILDKSIEIVDYILITHLHEDHYRHVNSLITALIDNDIQIKNVCWEKDKCIRSDKDKAKNYKDFTNKLLENHSNFGIENGIKKFSGKNYIRLDNDIVKEFKAKIIYPNSLAANTFNDNNINNTSTVVQIEYNNFKIILPGDLEGQGWYMLKTYIDDLKCDILKMPHHGGYFEGKSNAMSTGEVIDYTSPKFAIISTGQNDNYKHPYKETIDYLASKNINTICTEVTDLCDKDRLNKKACVISKLGIKYNGSKKSCPCAGDIIFEIDDEIKLVSHNYDKLNEVRNSFEDRQCIDIKK